MTSMTFVTETVKSPEALAAVRPDRAYRAHLYDQSGILTKLNGTIYFIADEDQQITKFEPEMINWCTVLGEVVTAERQRIHDYINGGPARIATTRPLGHT
jgi:hypothetical protein